MVDDDDDDDKPGMIGEFIRNCGEKIRVKTHVRRDLSMGLASSRFF